MTRDELRQLIKLAIAEVIRDLLGSGMRQEVSTSAAAGPYMTPKAFQGTQQDKKKRKEKAEKSGMTVIGPMDEAVKKPKSQLKCADCGKVGERTGHQDCQYPQNHENESRLPMVTKKLGTKESKLTELSPETYHHVSSQRNAQADDKQREYNRTRDPARKDALDRDIEKLGSKADKAEKMGDDASRKRSQAYHNSMKSKKESLEQEGRQSQPKNHVGTSNTVTGHQNVKQWIKKGSSPKSAPSRPNHDSRRLSQRMAKHRAEDDKRPLGSVWKRGSTWQTKFKPTGSNTTTTSHGHHSTKQDAERYRDSMTSPKKESPILLAPMIKEKSPPGWSGTVKAMKKHKDKIDNPFALAWWEKERGAHPHHKPE